MAVKMSEPWKHPTTSVRYFWHHVPTDLPAASSRVVDTGVRSAKVHAQAIAQRLW